jgi:hypothetical protein
MRRRPDPLLQRRRQIDRLRCALERDHYPRLQMGSIVTLTGLAGLAASFLMLLAGLESMGLRYFFAMVVAYLVFFLLLWAWLRTRGEFDLDVPSGGGSDPAPGLNGNGGSFDGGGASGDYQPADSAASSGGDAGGDIGVDIDVGDAAIPLAVLVLAAGIVLSSLFVVYSAPVLFAELLLDGALAAGLYRGLRGLDRRHWLESALRRTLLPFVLTTVVVTAAGWGMGRYAPEARSIGEVLQHRAAADPH